MNLFRKSHKAELLAEKCCGVIALEIQAPGKPLLLFCPKCGRKWEPAPVDPKLIEAITYFEVLGSCLEDVFQVAGKK
ncbi:MAG TPA: hypothetical protein VMS73_10320 [Anaerolineaceae bacterium]|nr:hypothetical protein [Anaerolineaceae bacterium]